MGAAEVEAFLTHLAVTGKVPASTLPSNPQLLHFELETASL
jgi:hypothetical protein